MACEFLFPWNLYCWSRTSCMLGLACCARSQTKIGEDELLCGKGLVPTKHEVQAVSCP